MADPSSNDGSNYFDGVPMPVTDRSDPNWNWNYDYLNPYGNYIASLPDQMPGPLSWKSINGSPLLYTDPQAYATMRDANNGLGGLGSDMTSEVGQPSDGWDIPIGDASGGSTALFDDTMLGGGGNDIAGDASGNPTILDHFGHPNPLSPPDPAYRGELTQDADRALKSAGVKMTAGGLAAAILGPELPPPLDALSEGAAAVLTPMGRALRNDFIRGLLAHFAGTSAFDQMANAIQDANNALGNQYMHDAGGLP